ncbi:HAD-like domain-containing protein [Armillaria novae-zelandiae]|uniref:HAD-like domain-containing protein n=1 Tax=Armillaria novae-zelandiae TaxID=153914 RepID=A0AA39P3B0_9AGAR|nr:HAD-like domain-containing protein [Armillaria novae-zelandiae]
MVATTVEYVIFDLDGLLIDTERIHTQVTNQILAPHGEEMTWDIKAGCMGKPERASAEYLLSFFPSISLSVDSYIEQKNILQNKLLPSVPLLPGVRKFVQHLRKHGVPIAVATSSGRLRYEKKTGHLRDVFDCFEGNIVCADDEKWEAIAMKAKPSPDIFLVAARELLGRDVAASGPVSEDQNLERKKGLVFEDGFAGVQAGKRAGMNGVLIYCFYLKSMANGIPVVWVPDSNLLGVEYTVDEKADVTLRSIADFIPERWGLPPYDKEL